MPHTNCTKFDGATWPVTAEGNSASSNIAAKV